MVPGRFLRNSHGIRKGLKVKGKLNGIYDFLVFLLEIMAGILE